MDPFAYILPPETAQIHCGATGLALFRRPQFRAKPLAWMGGGYGKVSKNPTQHLTVLGCDAAEAEMANDGLPGRRDHPVQC